MYLNVSMSDCLLVSKFNKYFLKYFLNISIYIYIFIYLKILNRMLITCNWLEAVTVK